MGRKYKTDLVIVTNEPFPIGLAATNRILSYAYEIAKQKKVLVLIAKPTELPKNIKNSKNKGTYNNIRFKYVHTSNIWPKSKSKIYKAFTLILGVFMILKKVNKLLPHSILMAGISSSPNNFM